MTARLPKANQDIRRVGLGAFIEKENAIGTQKPVYPNGFG
jgi:hypothetical protein